MNKSKKVLIALGLFLFVLFFSALITLDKINLSKLKGDVSSTNIKLVSVMGDSISTFGSVTAGNPYYPRGNITSVNDTWWMGFINEHGFQLGYNYSWGGTTLAYRTDAATDTWFYSDVRVNSLGKNGIPDYIIIFGGTNDMNANPSSPIGNFNNTTDGSTVIGAYYTLISKLKTKYPNAKLVGIIPMKIPKFTDAQYKEYHDAFEKILDNNTIPYVDLSKVSELQLATGCKETNTCDTSYFIDHLHPNKAGATLIKNELNKLFNKTTSVTFYRNYSSSDNTNVTKTFRLGEFNQKFNNNGWTRPGYSLMGWGKESTSTTKSYNTNSNVYDWWIQKNNNVKLYAIWEPYIMSVKYDANGGTIKEYTNDNGVVFGKNGSLVTINGSTTFLTLKYGDKLPTTGFANYNNPSYIYITKSGYLVENGKEWKDKNGNEYSQSVQYSVSDFASACDVSSSNCDLVMYVNWKKKVAVPTCSAKTYTGSEQTLLSSGTGYNASNNKGTNAGTYSVKVSLVDGYIWSDGTSADKTVTCTINKKQVSVPTCPDKTYTGSSQTLMSNGTGYTVSNNKGTNAGSYPVSLALSSNNYIWNDSTTANKTVTCKINRKAVSIPTTCTAKEYTGSSQTLMSNGTGYTVKNNTGTNAGTYNVGLSIKDNYKWSDETLTDKSVSCSITPYGISKTNISVTNKIYSGRELIPTVTVKHGSKSLVKGTDYTVTFSDNIEVGTGHATIMGSGNYSGTVTKNFTIYSPDDMLKIIDSSVMELSDDIIYTTLLPGVNSLNKNEFWENIDVKGGTWHTYDKNNNEITDNGDAIITTGSYLKYGVSKYPIIILGDINQDGIVSIKDLYQSYLLYKNKATGLNEYQIAAGDYNRDGSTNIHDLYEIYIKMKEK